MVQEAELSFVVSTEADILRKYLIINKLSFHRMRIENFPYFINFSLINFQCLSESSRKQFKLWVPVTNTRHISQMKLNREALWEIITSHHCLVVKCLKCRLNSTDRVFKMKRVNSCLATDRFEMPWQFNFTSATNSIKTSTETSRRKKKNPFCVVSKPRAAKHNCLKLSFRTVQIFIEKAFWWFSFFFLGVLFQRSNHSDVS